MNMEYKELMQLAEEARERAYAPYSHFRVGAALLSASGKVYMGCNIENASYGATMCAERTALFKAVSEGEREFSAIAISGAAEGKQGSFCAPCGICRQALSEFCSMECAVILGDSDNLKVYTMGELLPLSFRLPD